MSRSLSARGALLRAKGYELLGVDPKQVASQPQIAHQIRQVFLGMRRGGQEAPTDYIYYLRGSDSKEARMLLDVHDSIPISYAKYLPVEALCVAASVSPLRILEIIISTCVRMGAQSSALIAAVNHPRVVQKTVDMALTDEGINDRMTLHKATGFLPTPKSAQTTINVQQNASAVASPQIAVVAPPPEQTIRKLADRFNERRALPPTTAVPIPEPELEREPVVVHAAYEDEDE